MKKLVLKLLASVMILAITFIALGNNNVALAENNSTYEVNVENETELATVFQNIKDNTYDAVIINITDNFTVSTTYKVLKGIDLTIKGNNKTITASTTNKQSETKQYLDHVFEFQNTTNNDFELKINDLTIKVGDGFRYGVVTQVADNCKTINSIFSNVNITMERSNAPIEKKDSQDIIKYGAPLLVKDSTLNFLGNSKLVADKYCYVAIDITAKRNDASITVGEESKDNTNNILNIIDNRIAEKQYDESLIKLTTKGKTANFTRFGKAMLLDSEGNYVTTDMTSMPETSKEGETYNGYNFYEEVYLNVYSSKDLTKASEYLPRFGGKKIVMNIFDDISIDTRVSFKNLYSLDLVINGNDKKITGENTTTHNYDRGEDKEGKNVLGFLCADSKKFYITINNLEVIAKDGFRDGVVFDVNKDVEYFYTDLDATLNNVKVTLNHSKDIKKSSGDTTYAAGITVNNAALTIKGNTEIKTDKYCYSAIDLTSRVNANVNHYDALLTSLTIDKDATFNIDDGPYNDETSGRSKVKKYNEPLIKLCVDSDDNSTPKVTGTIPTFTDNRTTKVFAPVTDGYNYKINIENEEGLDAAVKWLRESETGKYAATWNITDNITITSEKNCAVTGSTLTIEGNKHTITADFNPSEAKDTKGAMFKFDSSKSTNYINDLKLVVKRGFRHGIFVQTSSDTPDDQRSKLVFNNSSIVVNHIAAPQQNKGGTWVTKDCTALLNNGAILVIKGNCSFETDQYCYNCWDVTNFKEHKKDTFTCHAEIMIDKDATISFVDNRNSTKKASEALIGFDKSDNADVYPTGFTTGSGYKSPYQVSLFYKDKDINSRTKNGYDLIGISTDAQSTNNTFLQRKADDLGIHFTNVSLTDAKSIEVYLNEYNYGSYSKLRNTYDYEVEEGSILATIKEDYINKLLPGSHTIRVNITDQKNDVCTYDFAINIEKIKVDKYTLPKTGIK